MGYSDELLARSLQNLGSAVTKYSVREGKQSAIDEATLASRDITSREELDQKIPEAKGLRQFKLGAREARDVGEQALVRYEARKFADAIKVDKTVDPSDFNEAFNEGAARIVEESAGDDATYGKMLNTALFQQYNRVAGEHAQAYKAHELATASQRIHNVVAQDMQDGAIDEFTAAGDSFSKIYGDDQDGFNQQIRFMADYAVAKAPNSEHPKMGSDALQTLLKRPDLDSRTRAYLNRQTKALKATEKRPGSVPLSDQDVQLLSGLKNQDAFIATPSYTAEQNKYLGQLLADNKMTVAGFNKIRADKADNYNSHALLPLVEKHGDPIDATVAMRAVTGFDATVDQREAGLKIMSANPSMQRGDGLYNYAAIVAQTVRSRPSSKEGRKGYQKLLAGMQDESWSQEERDNVDQALTTEFTRLNPNAQSQIFADSGIHDGLDRKLLIEKVDSGKISLGYALQQVRSVIEEQTPESLEAAEKRRKDATTHTAAIFQTLGKNKLEEDVTQHKNPLAKTPYIGMDTLLRGNFAKAHAADIEDLVLDDSVYANFNTLLQDLTASGLQEPAQITEEVERFFDPRNYTLGGGNIGRLSLIPTSSAHRVNFYMDKLPEQYQQDTKGFLRHALVEAPIQQVEDTVLRSISGTQGQPTRELEKQFALRDLRHTFRDEVGDAETAQKAMRQQLDRRINATDIRITGIEATANPSVVKINYHDPTGHIDGVLFDMQNQDTRIISRSGDAKLFTDSIYGDGGG